MSEALLYHLAPNETVVMEPFHFWQVHVEEDVAMVKADLNNDASSLPDGLFPVPLGSSKLGSWSAKSLDWPPAHYDLKSVSKFLCL